MRRSMLFLFPLALLVPSCDDEPDIIGPANRPVGEFLFSMAVKGPPNYGGGQAHYSARGTLSLSDAAGTFGGYAEYAWEYDCDTSDCVVTQPLTNVVLEGDELRFDAGTCTFKGTLVGDPASGIAGWAACIPPEEGQSPEGSGEWTATLGVASVIVSPDPAGILLGDTIQLRATLIGSDGEEWSDRTVTWASADPSIVTVDQDGRAARVGLGEVEITATSVPVYPLEEAVSGAVVAVGGLRFVSVEVGVEHACGVTGDGRVFCWGRGDSGQLGTGVETPFEDLPVEVVGGPRFSAVSVGFAHTCGIAEARGGYCWGSNEGGALGDGSFVSSSVPVAVVDGGAFSEVSAGAYMTCAMVSLGGRYCWGTNDHGQLGIGAIGGPDQPSPKEVVEAGLLEAWAVTKSPAGGGAHVCGVTNWEPGSFCWGHGSLGELGNGETVDYGTPQRVSFDSGFDRISVGADHSCGLTTEGEAYCWGHAPGGPLGIGSIEPAIRATPVPVEGELSFEGISAGDHFTCAITRRGKRAYCWGWGGSHQLGNGEAIDRLEPTPVAGSLLFASISAGGGFACGMGKDGFAYCWGANDWGQLGTGDLETRTTPTRVALQ